MADCGQRSVDRGNRHSGRPRRARYHQHRYTELSRRFDLGIGSRAAGVLGNNEADAVFSQELDFVLHRKGTARRDVAGMRHAQRRLDGIDTANEVMVLGSRLKRQQFLTAKGQEGVFSVWSQSLNRSLDIGNILPVIAIQFFPSGSLKSNQRDVGHVSRLRRVGGYLRRIGVGGIDKKIKAVFGDEGGKAIRPAKAAAAHRHRLRHGIAGAACHGQQKSVAGFVRQFASQYAGIRCATENEYGACHGL
jgi:hypothetical protein